ncbi:uncharacterized protein METZ01_LOCUS156902, partial [marine metagenome]
MYRDNFLKKFIYTMSLTTKLKSNPKIFWEITLLVCMYGAYAVLNICRTTVVI